MVVFHDSFRNYYVLVLPIESERFGYKGNIGLLKYYRKKGKAGAKVEISTTWEPPSRISDPLPDSEFDKWYKYILKNTTEKTRREVLKLILSGKVAK